MTQKDYKLSFTTGGLFYCETLKSIHLFDELQDWGAVKRKLQAENLLQARTSASATRSSRELIQRLQTLTASQLEILRDGTRQDQVQILWLAVCKQYDFVYEFATQVLHGKYLKLDFFLSYDDFDEFFNSLAEWNENLEKTTETTRKKLRQVLFRMIREADLLSAKNAILPVILSSRVIEAIMSECVGTIKD